MNIGMHTNLIIALFANRKYWRPVDVLVTLAPDSLEVSSLFSDGDGAVSSSDSTKINCYPLKDGAYRPIEFYT